MSTTPAPVVEEKASGFSWKLVFWRFAKLSIATFVAIFLLSSIVTFLSTGGLAEVARQKAEIGNSWAIVGIWVGVIFGSFAAGGIWGFTCWGFLIIPLIIAAIFWDVVTAFFSDLRKIFLTPAGDNEEGGVE